MNKVERFGLVDLAGDMGVETVMLDRGLDLEQLTRDAVARGAIETLTQLIEAGGRFDTREETLHPARLVMRNSA